MMEAMDVGPEIGKMEKLPALSIEGGLATIAPSELQGLNACTGTYTLHVS